MTVGTTTQGAGFLGLLSSNGLSILVGVGVLILFCIGISYFRRMGGGTRGGDKRF